jgi:hypothetical protein
VRAKLQRGRDRQRWRDQHVDAFEELAHLQQQAETPPFAAHVLDCRCLAGRLERRAHVFAVVARTLLEPLLVKGGRFRHPCRRRARRVQASRADAGRDLSDIGVSQLVSGHG